MYRKARFVYGQRVTGQSTCGKTIIGTYRGVRSSFGMLILGLEVGTSGTPKLWPCLSLTVQAINPKAQSPARFLKPIKLVSGDSCRGVTKNGKKIVGIYMQKELEFAWIRGWEADSNRLAPQQAYKVLFSSLQPL